MTKLICILIGLGLTVGTAAGRPVVFKGLPPANADKIERLAARDNVPADSLLAVLLAEGYLDAVVTVDSSGVVVSAGSQATLRSVIVAGEEDSSVVGFAGPFTRALVERITDSLVADRQNAGHYFATVSFEKIVRSGEEVTLHVRSTPGPMVRVGSIRYVGLRRVRAAFIERYLSVTSGDSLTDEGLERIERAAGAIPLVRFVPPVAVRPRPGYAEADLELTFAEDHPLAFELGGGYVPDSREDELVWHVDARFSNLLGGGRSARILSERREEGRQVLQVGYAQPVFLLGLGRVRGEVATRDYRESFYEFAVTGGWEARIQPDLTAGVDLGYRGVEPSGNQASFRAYQAGFSVSWERLADPLNPREGFRAATRVAYSHRRYSADTLSRVTARAFNETRTRFDAAVFQPLVGALVGHVGVGYQGLETAEDLPPLSELVLVGGPGTIRGYRNEQFAVVRAALLTVEPRVRFGSGYLFGFVDGAYLNNRVASVVGTRTDEEFKTGYGLGLAVVTQRRGVKLSLGWNPDLGYDEARLSIQFTSEI